MKRLLSSTTALSMAMFNVQPWPLMAQTLTEEGYVVAADGTVLCEPTAEAACVPEDYIEQAQAIEAAMAAQAEADAAAAAAAQAEADAAAATQAEAEAAAAAQAEADAAAAAQTEADAAAAAAQAEAEAAAAAQAEADAAGAAQAEADAAAAAQAEADAAAAAQAEADAAAAQAEADAAAAVQAETDAAAATAQAEAEAAAAAEADAAAQAEADAAQAEADAAQEPVAEEPVAEEPAVEEPVAEEPVAEEPAVEEPAVEEPVAEEPVAEEPVAEEPAVVEPVAEEPVVEEPVAEEPVVEEPVAEEPVAEEPVAEEPVAEEPVAEEPVTEEPVVEEPVTEEPVAEPAATEEATPFELTPEELAAQEAARAAAETELAVQPDGTLVDPAAGLVSAEPVVDPDAVPVEAPVPTEAEVETLSDLLAQPDAVDPASRAAAETLLAEPVPEGQSPADIAPSAEAVATVTEMLTDTGTRTSTQEFAAAPVALAGGKKDRLSDLEKVGLVALGALVVGAIINANNKAERRQVVSNTGDRVVVLKPDGTYQVYKDDDAVIRRPGSTVRTETYRDGSTRSIVERPDGTQIVTIRDASGRVLRRAQYDELGRELVLIDDLEPEEVVIVRDLPRPTHRHVVISTQDDDAELKAALAAKDINKLGRKFSLRQIREIQEVRWLAAMIDVDTITFDSGSSAIKASEAEDLADLGRLMQDMIDRNPGEMFLIEGHTDAVGKAAMNLALSDRRAESVALALTEYFDIPPENMVIQGYGETELRIDTLQDEKRNRRAAVRIITPLMRTAR